MAFEFYGADLETEEGIETFKTVYTAVHESNSAECFKDDLTYEQWAKDRPELAERFLRSLADDSRPQVRNLAGRLAYREWTGASPDLAVEVISKVMMDEDPVARGTISWFMEDSMEDEDFDTWLRELGLPRIERLLNVIHQAKQTYGDTRRRHS